MWLPGGRNFDQVTQGQQHSKSPFTGKEFILITGAVSVVASGLSVGQVTQGQQHSKCPFIGKESVLSTGAVGVVARWPKFRPSNSRLAALEVSVYR